MIRTTLAAATALCLLSTGLAAAQGSIDGCPASAEREWRDGAAAAVAIGPDCAHSALLVTLRRPDGALLYVSAHQPENLFGFEEATAPDAMTAALTDWINQSGPGFDSVGDLPEWSGAAPGQVGGEFPFYLEEWVDEATYTGLRDADAPMFCYVQGMESMACVAFFESFGEDGIWEKLGVQSFPG